jgi:aspartyl-tRNA(Asn)/glutamyl-tRNA(Gln) amidotransferase subunit A
VGLLITVPRHRDDMALRLARILEIAAPWPLHPAGWE